MQLSPRLLQVTTAVSGIFCIAFVGVWLVSFFLDVSKHGMVVNQNFHIGFFNGAVSFYSHDVPYRGSIIQIDGYPPILALKHFTFVGIYYRYFRFPSETVWTLIISLAYPVIFFSVLPALWMRRRMAKRSHQRLL